MTDTGVEYSFADIGAGFFMVVLGIIFLVGFMACIDQRKTQKYRKELTDLYVAGRIRQIAEKDKIDLNAEYETYKKWRRLRRREDKDLDNAIEDELIEKIGEDEKPIKEKKA